MSNDARLGLVVGLGLVLTVAAVFFRKDLITRKPAVDRAAATTVSSGRPSPTMVPRGLVRPARGRTVAQTDTAERGSAAGVRHVVREGETLDGLARHYYGDAAKAAEIRRANPDVANDPEPLEPGTTVVIPELP